MVRHFRLNTPSIVALIHFLSSDVKIGTSLLSVSSSIAWPVIVLGLASLFVPVEVDLVICIGSRTVLLNPLERPRGNYVLLVLQSVAAWVERTIQTV